MLHGSFRLYLRKAVRKIWYFSSDGACDVRDILSKLLSVPYYTLLTPHLTGPKSSDWSFRLIQHFSSLIKCDLSKWLVSWLYYTLFDISQLIKSFQLYNSHYITRKSLYSKQVCSSLFGAISAKHVWWDRRWWFILLNQSRKYLLCSTLKQVGNRFYRKYFLSSMCFFAKIHSPIHSLQKWTIA